VFICDGADLQRTVSGKVAGRLPGMQQGASRAVCAAGLRNPAGPLARLFNPTGAGSSSPHPGVL